MSGSTFPSAWNDRYKDLPLLTRKPSPVNDDDIQFASDMAYFKDLLLEIQLQTLVIGQARPFPLVLSDELDHALAELAGIKYHIREMTRG